MFREICAEDVAHFYLIYQKKRTRKLNVQRKRNNILLNLFEPNLKRTMQKSGDDKCTEKKKHSFQKGTFKKSSQSHSYEMYLKDVLLHIFT